MAPSAATAQDGMALLPLPDRAAPRRAVARAVKLELFQPRRLDNGRTQLVPVGDQRLPLPAGNGMALIAVVTGPHGLALPRPVVSGDGTNVVFPARGRGLPLGRLQPNMQRTATFVVITAPEDVEDQLGRVTVTAGSLPLKYVPKDETEPSARDNQAPEINAPSRLELENGKGSISFEARDPEGQLMFPSARTAGNLSVQLTRGDSGNRGEVTVTSSDPTKGGTVVLVVADSKGAFTIHTVRVVSEEEKKEGRLDEEDGAATTDRPEAVEDDGTSAPNLTGRPTPGTGGSGSGNGSSSRSGRRGKGIIGVLETEVTEPMSGPPSKP